MSHHKAQTQDLPRFDPSLLGSEDCCMRIGDGGLGGKAQGLVFARDVLRAEYGDGEFPDVDVEIPRMIVVATDVFDAFMADNGLEPLALSDAPDGEIAGAFEQGALPADAVKQLRALVEKVAVPLVVRSSSFLEDALFRPFAGVYETRMIPNNDPDVKARLEALLRTIRLVYASTYFRRAKNYIRATDRTIYDEKMAVIIQEVVGHRHGDRFYPDISGVARSYNFYPISPARPAEGVINLALGLGKTIVDGGLTWWYSPTRPQAPPPFGSTDELLAGTQSDFWAVNMTVHGTSPCRDEEENLLKLDLAAAEEDGTLRHVASTYDPQSDRLSPGTGARGPRAVNFAPLLVLRQYPVNDVVASVLRTCERVLEGAVEIEFAMTLPRPGRSERARLGFLQVRPMVVTEACVDVSDEELAGPDVLASSKRAMGNGVVDTIRDVVYVRPDTFEARFTRRIAAELEQVNTPLLRSGSPYLLIGFGRWGSADPWLGIPVNWGQICGSKVIVETTLPDMDVDPSQGSHFFQNITSFQVSFLSVSHRARPGIDWDWLAAQPADHETEFIRHVRLKEPIVAKVDGRTGRGAILRPA